MIADLLQEDLERVQAFLLLDIKDKEDISEAIEKGNIWQGASRGSDVSAACAYYIVDSNDKEGVDKEMADHLWERREFLRERQINSEGEFCPV